MSKRKRPNQGSRKPQRPDQAGAKRQAERAPAEQATAHPEESQQAPRDQVEPERVEAEPVEPEQVEAEQVEAEQVEAELVEPEQVEAAQATAEPAEAAPAGLAQPGERPSMASVDGRSAWRRLLRMGRPRPTKANLLSALLAVLLGTAIATQVQLTNSRGLEDLSQSDLVRVLDDVSVRSSRLDQQVRELEATRDRLKNGTGDTAEAMQQAENRVDTLGILAGAVPAHGPGIHVTISDPDRQVTGPVVLDLIQELRDAGAEAIDVGGVRVVASTFIGNQNNAIQVDGHNVARPIEVKAIGDSKTLASAMTIPGGVVESVRQKGGTAVVTEVDDVRITSIHEATPLTHATPAE